MTWNAFHHRGEILQSVIDEANARRNGVLPMDLPGVRETFRDELDLLGALSLKWHARLSGNIERELMAQPLDLESAIITAWRRAAADAPGVRMVLDHYTAAPSTPEMAVAMTRAQEKEWLKLASVAGLASDESAAAARAGQRLTDAARAGIAAAPAPQDVDEVVTPSLVDRIRAVLAA